MRGLYQPGPWADGGIEWIVPTRFSTKLTGSVWLELNVSMYFQIFPDGRLVLMKGGATSPSP